MSDDGFYLFFEETLEHRQAQFFDLRESHLSEAFVSATVARSRVNALESILNDETRFRF